jgi:hypothetical protein
MSYKLVDTFNGWESDTRYPTIREARRALRTREKAFHAANTNAIFKGAIVHSNATWGWDERANTFMWTNPTKEHRP